MRLSDYTQSGDRGLFKRDRRIFDQRGTFTFTIPDGVTQIWAFVIGAGGGASTGNNYDEGLLTGGAGGGYTSGIISGLTPGNTLDITVGAGGVGKVQSDSGTTDAAAGGDSTVVGGSTTYLLGEGGAAGNAQITGATNIVGAKGEGKGGGGQAQSTSVTNVYAAAGGGSGTTVITSSTNNTIGTHMNLAGGGGASGSPFGTGMNGGKFVFVYGSRIAGGGGGWTQKDYQHLTSTYQVPSLNSWSAISGANGTLSFPGYGSHQPPKFFYNENSGEAVTNSMWGGRGRTAKGGISLTECTIDKVAEGTGGQYGNNYVTNYYPLMEKIHGEDANPNWWFPWEIDGGGGGGASLYETNQLPFVGGNGASGGGGGGVSCDNYDSQTNLKAMMHGGDGGFGGGGGAMMANIEQEEEAYFNADMVFVGGRGGNGGGGGACVAPRGGGHYLGIGGEGGDGCVGLYW